LLFSETTNDLLIFEKVQRARSRKSIEILNGV